MKSLAKNKSYNKNNVLTIFAVANKSFTVSRHIFQTILLLKLTEISTQYSHIILSSEYKKSIFPFVEIIFSNLFKFDKQLSAESCLSDKNRLIKTMFVI